MLYVQWYIALPSQGRQYVHQFCLLVVLLSQLLAALTHIGFGGSFGHGFQALGSWGCCFTCCHNVTSLKKYLANFVIVWLYNPANTDFICDHALTHVTFGSVSITVAQSISYARTVPVHVIAFVTQTRN